MLDPDDRGIRENLELLASDARSKDDIDDEGFEGASIQLGDDDGSASDELATTTLADIYASQGYTDKAIRIYREVLARQPDNAEVRDKIRSLEGEPAPEQADEPATGSPATGSPATGSPATGSPGPIIELPADDDVVFEEVPESGSASRPMLPRTRPRPRVPFALGHEQKPAPDERRGTPIDEGRSYEQFKRWLKNIAD
ncbi:MAG: tetratricopeptide repeat protein [Candidatus Krumholzibacteriota bacterium]|nr:tetratricopeptide repeat protein [Candidatus Krumholzibacteriota bacterium]